MLDHYNRILVTGGLGFIGGHLVDALLTLAKEVVVVDNLSTGLKEEPPPGARLVQADVRHPLQLESAMKDAELVFHVAANANGTFSVEDPRFDFETNALGTFNVLEAARRARSRRLVYISSASVYGRPERLPIGEDHPKKPFLPYGASKLAGEACCLAFHSTYDLPAVIARPFCVYGPGENPRVALVEVSRYLRWHLNDMPIQVVGDAERKTRDFVHVSDVIRGLLIIADAADGGSIFNIGSGEEVSMRGLTEVIGSVTGRKARVDEISDVTDDTYRLVADISKLESLGFTPAISLEDGVKELSEEFGEEPELPSVATVFKEGQRAERQAVR